jgi:hypothetical protein
MSKKEIKEFYASPEGKKLDADTFKEWDTLVNMSKSEIEKFYNSEEGKEAGLSQEKANELGIDNGRTSARWIMKMKDIDYRNWTSEMWIWAKKQISFIKRMSGNKGSLYDENGNKTRKHTSLLIWGHNPDKLKAGGKIKPAKKVSELLKALTDAFSKKDSNNFDNLVNKIHEISDNEGLTENEYKQWDTLREKMREFEQERFSKEFKDKYAKGGRAKKSNSGGDCYQTAGNIALDLAKGLNSHEFIGTPYVVHAEVAGQGAISGVRYGHAWVEDDVFVYDFSNGRSIIFPKQLYYQLGQVIQKKPKYYKYTFKEARAKMIESGHYGSWDLKTESGL